VIVDTSALLAFFDSREPLHDAVAEALTSASGLLVISPYVLAEVDYLVATRHGLAAELAVLDELTGGAWELASLDVPALQETRAVIEKYDDQNIGLADASMVILAERYRTSEIATLDRRHFGVMRTIAGQAFDISP
jgi:predicted nucleic acid-binding protein